MARDTLGQSGDAAPAAPVLGPRTWTLHLLLVIAAAGVTMAFPGLLNFNGRNTLQGGLWMFITVVFVWTTVSTFRKRRGRHALGWALITVGAAAISVGYLLAGNHMVYFAVAAAVLLVSGLVVTRRGNS